MKESKINLGGFPPIYYINTETKKKREFEKKAQGFGSGLTDYVNSLVGYQGYNFVKDTVRNVSDLGVDFTWTMTFRFLRDDLLSKLNSANQGQGFGTFQQPFIQYGADIHPEVGDIIQYQNGYWEVDNTNSTQYFMGKDPDYPYYDDANNNPLNPGLENFGYNVEVRCDCHYVPSDRLNIIKSRM